MKKGLHYLKIILLASILMIGGTACMEHPIEHPTELPVSSSHPSGGSSPTATAAKSEERIVAAILFDIGMITSPDGSVAVCTEEAEKLSGKLFGRITSVEDAKEKATAALIELLWCEQGEPDEMEESLWRNRPINTRLYEEHDAWLVWGTHPVQTLPDGREVPVPSTVPYLVMRQSNGEVLAVWPG